MIRDHMSIYGQILAQMFFAMQYDPYLGSSRFVIATLTIVIDLALMCSLAFTLVSISTHLLGRLLVCIELGHELHDTHCLHS